MIGFVSTTDNTKPISWKTRWLELAEVVDAFRLIPRTLMSVYIWFLVDIHFWFKALEEPSTAQQLYANIVWGAFAILGGWYFNTGRKWKDVD